MIAFNVQNLRGFESPPSAPAGGLIGIGQFEQPHQADPYSAVNHEGEASAFEALVTQRQFRPALEQPVKAGATMLIGVGSASALFGGMPYAYATFAAPNDASALFRDLLAEASMGIDEGQKKHLRAVKRALDAERLPGSKLFR